MLRAAPAFRSPLILLAAVHHLLLTDAAHAPLARYYPTVRGDAAQPLDDGLYPAFASFVDARRDEVARLVATRSTQTNEARRTVVTLPALGLVEHEGAAPLALLEIGASAGLNLLPDRYAYRIGDATCGDGAAPVLLTADAEGDLLPPVPARPPTVAWRLGVDLNPLDVADPATRAWLRALVWPEHRDRLETLDAALALAQADPPLVVRGDLTGDLPAAAAEAPRSASLAVVSTWVLAYVEPKRRRELLATLAGLANARGGSVWLVACEAASVLASLDLGLVEPPAEGYGPSTLSLHRLDPDGGRRHRLLAICHPHGRWIRWLDPATAAGRT